MKRLISSLLAFAVVFTLVSPVLAVEETDSSPISIIYGVQKDQQSITVGLRAVNEPTSFAPSSWYGVQHYWTAKYYTWSSYKFTFNKGLYFRSVAKQPFTVEFYYSDGTYISSIGSESAGLYDYVVDVVMDGAPSSQTGYYVKIVNDGSQTISSDAYYKVQSTPF